MAIITPLRPLFQLPSLLEVYIEQPLPDLTRVVSGIYFSIHIVNLATLYSNITLVSCKLRSIWDNFHCSLLIVDSMTMISPWYEVRHEHKDI